MVMVIYICLFQVLRMSVYAFEVISLICVWEYALFMFWHVECFLYYISFFRLMLIEILFSS